MIIFGIDPGTATTGWGVIFVEKNQVSCLGVGVILTSSKELMEKRLVTIYKDLNILIKKYHPDAIVIENLFFGANSKTALLVGQARGVVLMTAELNHIATFSYTPLQVKIALTGFGRAQKSQMGEMVKKILNLNSIPKPDDAADALAIALTHSFSHKFKSKTSK
jgi:crossover junction endodeoxyribonuclease RuvC